MKTGMQWFSSGKPAKMIIYFVLTIFAVTIVFPMLITVLTSLKGNEESVIGGAASIFPRQFHFENYVRAMTATSWGMYFKNSVIVTLITVAGSLFFNTLAGYAFARIRFRYREILFVCLLVGLMVPHQVTIIPQFIILKNIPFFGGNDWLGSGGIGWLDSYYALIVPELSGSIGIFLARQYFLSFPKALDEAAYMDGMGYFRTYVSIFLPLSGPLIATLSILKTVAVWNDFFHPLIFTTMDSMRTIQLGLQVFRSHHAIQFNQLMAATLVVALPLIIVFILFQKQFIRSLISTSVKG